MEQSPKFTDLVGGVSDEAVQVAQDNSQKKRRSSPYETSAQKPGEMLTIRVDPRVWAEAIRLANGNLRRIEIEMDGSVMVHN